MHGIVFPQNNITIKPQGLDSATSLKLLLRQTDMGSI